MIATVKNRADNFRFYEKKFEYECMGTIGSLW